MFEITYCMKGGGASMTEQPDGRKINYLAAAAADILTRDADIADIKCLLFFVDGVRASLNNIRASRLLDVTKGIRKP